MSSSEKKPVASGSVQRDLKSLGKYDIVRCVGAGGMGTVFLAVDRTNHRQVALKVLSQERAENAILVRRFKAEGQAAAVLQHPNIVGIYEAGEADGFFYIALEFVDGTDVQNLLRKRRRIPVKKSIDIVRQITLGLEHAHEKRLVHRDIKPANMLIDRNGTVKLTDLGLARSLDNTLDTSITRDGTTVGTIDYMSPEQAADSKATDIRSDLYSLGCSWYHMLTGQPPFPNGSLTNKLAAHARNRPPDPRDLNPEVPEAVVAIIHQLMAKRPADRYQTPSDLLKDLDNPALALSHDADRLLSVLLEEDEDDLEPDDSGSFVVQPESQNSLSARKRQLPHSASSTIHIGTDYEVAEHDGAASESHAVQVREGRQGQQPSKKKSDPATSRPSTGKASQKSKQQQLKKEIDQSQQADQELAAEKRIAQAQDLKDQPQQKTDQQRRSIPQRVAEQKSKVAQKQQAKPRPNTAPIPRNEQKSKVEQNEQQPSVSQPQPAPQPVQEFEKPKTPASTSVPPQPVPPPLKKKPEPAAKKQKHGTPSTRLQNPPVPAPPPGPAAEPKSVLGPSAPKQKPNRRAKVDRQSAADAQLESKIGQQSATPTAEAAVENFFLQTNWKKVAWSILVPVVAIGLIWFAVKNWPTAKEVENPYLETAQSAPLPDAPQPTSSKTDAETGTDSNSSSTQVVETIEQRTQSTDWSVPEWKLPKPNETTRIKVSRGVANSTSTAANLNLALKSLSSDDTYIEISDVSRLPLERQDVRIRNTLQIIANQTQPLFVIDPLNPKEPRSAPTPWLTFEGGTVVIRGVHFLIHAEQSAGVTLFGLSNSRLKLSECSFSVVGSGPVRLIEQTSSGPQEVVMTNCLVRGEQLQISDMGPSADSFFAENCVFVCQSGTLWPIQQPAAMSSATLTLARCDVLTSGVIFDMESGQSSSGALAKIACNECWFGGLPADRGTAFRIRNWPEEIELTAQSLRQRGFDLRLVSHHFSPLQHLVEHRTQKQSVSTIDELGEWNAFRQHLDLPAGLASFQTDELTTASVVRFDPQDLAKHVAADPSLPVRRNALVGADVSLISTVSRQVIDREIRLTQLHTPFATPDAKPTREIRFDLSSKRDLQRIIDSDQVIDGTKIICHGSGLLRFPVLHIDNRHLILEFEVDGEKSLTLQPVNSDLERPLITVNGGSLTISKGAFTLPRVRGSLTAAQLVHVQNGGTLRIENCLITGKKDGEPHPMFSLIGSNSGAQANSKIAIVDSMIDSPGPVISMKDLASSVDCENSILVSQSDLFALSDSSEGAKLWLSRCTVSHDQTLLRLEPTGLAVPFPVLVEETIFAGPVGNSAEFALTNSPSNAELNEHLQWLELNSAHAATEMKLIASEQSKAGAIPQTWQAYWGVENIVEVIAGPQAVLFETQNLNKDEFQPADFKLLPGTQANHWNNQGGAIGAEILSIGPNPKPAQSTEELKQQQPQKSSSPF